MLERLSPNKRAKLTAAYHSLAFVEDGMRLGLGTGSTSEWLTRLLGARRHIEGLQIEVVPTSDETAALARAVGLQVISLDDASWLDLTIDGADEFDPNLSLTKGGGGALLREKIVATASDSMIVIADISKEVAVLGGFPLPVEIIPFGASVTESLIGENVDQLGLDLQRMHRRMVGKQPFITDEGNYIVDLQIAEISDPGTVGDALTSIAGVVETGLFVGIADKVIVGADSGEARILSVDAEEQLVDIEDGERLSRFLQHILD